MRLDVAGVPITQTICPLAQCSPVAESPTTPTSFTSQLKKSISTRLLSRFGFAATDNAHKSSDDGVADLK
jgi:hypothetical protein